MSGHSSNWYDEDAGPLVRLFTMTAGRTRPSGTFDLVALVEAVPGAPQVPPASPEAANVLALCQQSRCSVAEIGARTKLPLAVVRVLLGDLLALGQIHVHHPTPPGELPDEGILMEVINGLRAL
ncbi:DUF742 domain-containing protein [Streptomyces sp. NPDC005728]|uniref:DUF742 domain-containing protein n=1 Tax=Streptomyces sp. NPDC005728 TaxID=3157054 RepID=UPI0033C3F241